MSIRFPVFREQRLVGESAGFEKFPDDPLQQLQHHLLRSAGRTAFALIQSRVLLEARRKPIYTAMPVSQLTYELGFSDPAYFTRFFRKLSGVTPAAFRMQGAAGR